jgi:hypothetical protein
MRRYLILFFIIAGAFGLSNVGGILAAASDTDRVLVTPDNPTTNDSLIFSYHGVDHCCCTEFYNKKVTISDSTISLFASFDEENCKVCRCFMAGFNTTFSCQPIKAGKYKIYYSEDMYCPPDQMCPAIAMIIRSKLVGEIVVKPASISTGFAGEPKRLRQKLPRQILSYSSAEKMLIIRIAKPQYVTVTAYIVSGEKTTQLSSRKFLPAGAHSFRMDQERFASGVAIIHVKGENFSEVKMINFAN